MSRHDICKRVAVSVRGVEPVTVVPLEDGGYEILDGVLRCEVLASRQGRIGKIGYEILPEEKPNE